MFNVIWCISTEGTQSIKSEVFELKADAEKFLIDSLAFNSYIFTTFITEKETLTGALVIELAEFGAKSIQSLR